jgi:Fic/DOC family protein
MVLTWEPITDLPQEWSSLTDGELGPLLQFWNDQRGDLEQGGALSEFNKRLGREWSIETGQIEGVYNLDRGLTETLIERGIDSDLIPNQPGQKPPEIIAAIIQDHADVLEGLFQFVKGDRPISKGYIHELHAALLRHQDTTAVRDQFGNLFEARLLKGEYKERPNNPKKPDGTMHQYCPPEHVESEMERLLSLHAEHEKKGVPVEVEAAWLHHRFTQIHPYQDGNGRVAFFRCTDDPMYRWPDDPIPSCLSAPKALQFSLALTFSPHPLFNPHRCISAKICTGASICWGISTIPPISCGLST